MGDWRTHYYADGMADALDEMGAGDALTRAQIETLAESLSVHIENESMASGADQIPHPLKTELRQTRDDHKREQDRRDMIEEQKDATIADLRRQVSNLRYELSRRAV